MALEWLCLIHHALELIRLELEVLLLKSNLLLGLARGFALCCNCALKDEALVDVAYEIVVHRVLINL